jgi:putative SOS response-associated peptidase YedK
MCYSSQIEAEWKKYNRLFGAKISLDEYYHRYWHRPLDSAKKMRAMDLEFTNPATEDEQKIKDIIVRNDQLLADALTADITAQQARLAAAELKLAVKETKAALNERRIATNKIAQLEEKLADLRRTVPKPSDSRVFPGVFAPVMISLDGERTIVPMRYHCRPVGAPDSFDTQYPGTYNARRDSMGGVYWRKVWGHTHGVVLAQSFYEYVSLHDFEQRPLQPGESVQKVVVEFRSASGEELLLACLWSRWQNADGSEHFYSFALITDEPPPEVRAAGHDRCVIPIKPGLLDAWLKPNPADLAASSSILDDRLRPFFQARLAP